ncbi:cyclin-J [Drosophila ficusphila]|uniref:cyclin-J n=1 Tax=Drosophila ficusphila TaxID=30025 RepID=UPI0007E5E335|nr:cyclin-J [Drosophila ficusphila]
MDETLAVEENIFVVNPNLEKDHLQSDVERLAKTHWLKDYARDIFLTMKEQEMRRLPLFFLSPQLDERYKMLQLLQLVTGTYKLSRCALHLAAYYLDRFMDRYKIRQDKLQLVAITSLHIAAQIENTDAFIPRYSEMNRLVKNAYTGFEYKAVERKLLCFLDFELVRPTIASFVELFACSFLTRSDFAAYSEMLNDIEREHNFLPYQRYGSFEQMLAVLAQLLLRMADFTLTITTFAREPPSLLAAVCIAAVRQVSGVRRWSQYLVGLTSYTDAHVEPFIDVLSGYPFYQSLQPVCELPSNQSNESLSSPDSGFEESLNERTGLVVSNEVVTLGVGAYNIITVQLQEAAPVSTKAVSELQPTLKRQRLEDDPENGPPLKQTKDK